MGIKTIRSIYTQRNKSEKEGRRKGVKTTQQVIPIRKVFDDGIFLCADGSYSQSYRFSDLNYAVASAEDQEATFLDWSTVLNMLAPGATYKISVIKRKLSKSDFKKDILIPERQDGLQRYREEYNRMLLEKSAHINHIVEEKFITAAVNKKDIGGAHTFLSRFRADVGGKLNRMGSSFEEVGMRDRLRMLYNFFHPGEEEYFETIDCQDMLKHGHRISDILAADHIKREDDNTLRIGGKYARVLYLPPSHYATYLKDALITELCGLNKTLCLSIDIMPLQTDEALKSVESINLSVESNIASWQRRQNASNNFSAVLPYQMERERAETLEFLEDLSTRDQRMMMGLVTLLHVADTKEELDHDTEQLKSIAQKRLTKLVSLTYEQLDGMVTALPFGPNKLLDKHGGKMRSLTTESTAALMPFSVQEINHDHGIYFGENALSKNLIRANKRQLLNGNSFVLGVPGSGKSFAVKEEIAGLMLSTEDDIILLDPENEYTPLVQALGGEVITVSPEGENHINAMDINEAYGEGANPIILKSDFIMSLCEQLIGSQNIGPAQKSIIDRCVAITYKDYQENGYQGSVPTLKDFRRNLLKQKEMEAKDVALALELFTDGSLNTFAKETNVNTKSRLLCYDTLELSTQLQSIGMLIILDNILNRVTLNRNLGKTTWIVIDEIYLLFLYQYSAEFLYKLWKRVRKYGAFCTGITQNVEDLLRSPTARTMLANSEFIVMLNQAATDREELAKLLKISERQLEYVTNVESGSGLIKVGKSLIPFVNRLPTDTQLYKLITTKPDEVIRMPK